MGEREKVHVLALLGMSPGVITELLWHLVHVEGKHIVSLELWTTASSTKPAGARSLGDQWWMFRRLRESVGDVDASYLPNIPDVVPEPDAPSSSLPEEGAFLLTSPRKKGGPIPDIRDPEDADCFAECLYDRVRLLRELHPIRLVGGLAGGRKTMSAALQAAFSLHARVSDRLLHVLLHPDIEEDQNKKEKTLGIFAFPNEEVEQKMKIPLLKQMTVYEVPFPPIREFLQAPGKAERLIDQLDSASYDQLWRRLRAAAGAATACLVHGAGGPYLELQGGPQTRRIDLNESQLVAYEALVDNPAGLVGGALVALLQSRGGHQTERNLKTMLARLRDEIAGESGAQAFSDFAPRSRRPGKTGSDVWYIPAANRVVRS